MPWIESRFAIAWLLPLGTAVAALWAPWAAWAFMLGFMGLVALLERVPALQRSPAPSGHTAWHRACLLLHLPLQFGLQALGVAIAVAQPADAWGAAAVVALGLGVGGVSGSQGITFAHELGHSKRRLDRVAAWLLMGSVLYAHFMVEHYRGHHARAATHDDPASARRGESLWRFLPRTLAGSWASAWRLEAARLQQRRQGWARSPLLAATAVQGLLLVALAAAFGPWALLFGVVQAAQAVLLLETINYIEHYGLQRRRDATGRAEPFGLARRPLADQRHHRQPPAPFRPPHARLEALRRAAGPARAAAAHGLRRLPAAGQRATLVVRGHGAAAGPPGCYTATGALMAAWCWYSSTSKSSYW